MEETGSRAPLGGRVFPGLVAAVLASCAMASGPPRSQESAEEWVARVRAVAVAGVAVAAPPLGMPWPQLVEAAVAAVLAAAVAKEDLAAVAVAPPSPCFW